MPTLVEDKGRVQLFKNDDGTFSAFENGVYTPIKDYGQPPTPTTISNIVAADYYNGYRVVVFNGGHLWYVDSNWQKASVGPNGRDTENLTNSEVSSLFLGGSGSNTTPVQNVPITYNITGPASVDEGTIWMFPLQTTGLPAGTSLTYNITGIDPSRIVGGQLSGTVGIDASGSVPIPLPLAANNITDGTSTVTIRLSNGQASFTAQINDTSKGSTSAHSTLVEGSGAVKLYRNSDGTFSAFENGVYTPIKDFGSSIPTTISNIVAADWWNGYRVVVFSGGGAWYVNSNWQKANIGPNGESGTTVNVDGVGAITGSTNTTTTGASLVNDHVSLVEGFGQIKLYRNSDGTQSALENGIYYPLKDTSYGGSPNKGVSGFVAVDFYNDVRVAVYSSGAFWYMNAAWSKDTTGPNLQDTGNLSSSQSVNTLFLSETTVAKTNTPPVAQQVSSVLLDPLVTTSIALNLAAPTDVNGDMLAIRIDSLPSGVRISKNGITLNSGDSITVSEFTSLSATYINTASTSLGQLSFTVTDGKGGSTSSSVAFSLKSSTTKTVTKSGDDGSNKLEGTAGDDVISAGGGNDTIMASTGNDKVDGGTGIDTLIFSTTSTGASFSLNSDGSVKLTYGSSTQTLIDVERVQFSGKSYALDLNGNAGNAAKLIACAFGSSMIKDYLGVGISLVDGGMSLKQLNELVLGLGMMPAKNNEFVDLVFKNLVGRAPNQFESLIYTNMLNQGAQTQSSLLYLAESNSLVTDAITQVSLAGVALEYLPSVF